MKRLELLKTCEMKRINAGESAWYWIAYYTRRGIKGFSEQIHEMGDMISRGGGYTGCKV